MLQPVFLGAIALSREADFQISLDLSICGVLHSTPSAATQEQHPGRSIPAARAPLSAMNNASKTLHTPIARRVGSVSNRAQSGRALPWIVAVVALLAIGPALWWWRSQAAPGESVPGAAASAASASGNRGAGGGRRFGAARAVQPVSVQTVRRQDIHVSVNAIGSLAASNTAIVHAQVTGVLQSLHFKEGQQVRAGQVLAQIDPRAFQASVGQSEGTLARDKAQLDNARIDLARYRDLLAKDAVPKQQFDTQEALVRQLEGTVKADQGTLDSARLQLSYTRVTAPISGRVGLKQADLGNVVQPGDTNGIVSITQTRPIALVFSVPSANVPLITRRLRANQPIEVEALDRSGKTPLATGRVATVDNAIDAATDTIKVKALFPNDDDALFPNQAVSVMLRLDTLSDVVAVPQAAVLRGAQGFYVYVVNEDSSVSVKVVKPGAVDGDWMAVEGPLQPGERIVIDGVDRLRDGAKVEVIAADPAQRAGANAPPGGARRGGRGAAGAASGAASGAAHRPQPASAAQAALLPSAAASQGGAEERPRWMDRVPPEVAEKLTAMTPDERRAWLQKRREERAGATGASAPN
jgi:multidrug efflux system membrane fusion protein